MAALDEAGALLARGKLRHSYPHSWRSKAPLIFRNTPQWFISMETNGLRDKALAAIDATRFVPAAGRNRLRAMIEQRPDWCVSRQRLWGVPLPLFVEKATGEPLRDQAVIERVAEAFEAEGGDAWFTSDPAALSSGNDYARPTTSRSRRGRGLVRFRLDPQLRAGGPARAGSGRPRSIWRARTSTAAGSTPRSGVRRHPRAGRPTRRC